MTYDQRPMTKQKIALNRYTWWELPAFGWAIRDGVSLFLVAEGPGYSRRVGRALYQQLIKENRKPR